MAKHQLAYGIEGKTTGRLYKLFLVRSNAREYARTNSIPNEELKIVVVELRKTKKKA